MNGPARCGFSVRICGASGGGKPPASGGSVCAGWCLVGRGRWVPAVAGQTAHQATHDAQGLCRAETPMGDAGRPQACQDAVDEGVVTRADGFERGERALRLRWPRDPVLQTASRLSAIAAFLVGGQHRGPGPARKMDAFVGDQFGESHLPFGENVIECEAEGCRGAALACHETGDRAGGRIPLENRMQCVAGVEERSVPPRDGEVDEGGRALRARWPSGCRRFRRG